MKKKYWGVFVGKKLWVEWGHEAGLIYTRKSVAERAAVLLRQATYNLEVVTVAEVRIERVGK